MEKKKVDVGAVIDSANYFWVPFGITIMMIIIMLTDGYDLFLMGHVGNFLVKDWGITRAQLGPDQYGRHARHGGRLGDPRLAG